MCISIIKENIDSEIGKVLLER